MNIFVDESGTFTSTAAPNSWSVVAAYASPEADRRKLEALLVALRPSGSPKLSEVKLKDVTETAYLELLAELGSLNGLLYGVATDMALNSNEEVATHKAEQVQKVLANRDKMLHQSGRDSVTELGNTLLQMPNQLYVQTIVQVELFYKVIWSSTLYFSQRIPQTLSAFRWRVDQKDVRLTSAELTFRNVVPAVLQSKSIERPMPMLEGADYSHMTRFEYEQGKAPDYLTTVYGFPPHDAINLGKVLADDFKFVDSKTSVGVQVADLLASGLRRLLRGGFERNEDAARLFGRLMVHLGKDDESLQLVKLGHSPHPGNGQLAIRMRRLRAATRAMLVEAELGGRGKR